MVSSFVQERAALLSAWAGEAQKTPTNLLGTGKYGKVFQTTSPDAVVKLTESLGQKRGAQRQAFQEHVIGILQTLLVLKAYTPHFPLHLDTQIDVTRGTMHGQLFMESFPTNLHDASSTILRTPSDWISLHFQIMQALAILADFFQLVHNDLYPRNILICCRQNVPEKATYTVRNRDFQVCWPFLAALTDFGISSSPTLMGVQATPEVAQRLTACEVDVRFGRKAPSKHILHYRSLPIFSRDVYTILKWTVFPSRSVPCAPPAIVCWAKESLDCLDAKQTQFRHAEAVGDFLLDHFCDDLLSAHELPSVTLHASACRTDFAHDNATKCRDDLLEAAAHVLEKMPLPKGQESRSGTRSANTTPPAKATINEREASGSLPRSSGEGPRVDMRAPINEIQGGAFSSILHGRFEDREAYDPARLSR